MKKIAQEVRQSVKISSFTMTLSIFLVYKRPAELDALKKIRRNR